MTRYHVSIFVVVLIACSQPKSRSASGVPLATGTMTDTAVSVRSGASLYKRYCALCHGDEAQGYTADNAPQLRNPSFLQTANERFLWFAINAGRPGTPMSAFGEEFGGPLNETQIFSIMEYLRSLSPAAEGVDVDNVAVAGDSSLGEEVYRRECAGCHGDHGEGRNALSLRNPNFLATASDGFVRYAIENGRPSTPMKAFTHLSESEINGITAYIRTWASTVKTTRVVGARLPAPNDIVINPGGPAPSFGALKNGKYVSVDRLASELTRKPRLILLDARATSDWYNAHIEGAYPSPFYRDVDPLVKILPRDGTWIVAYCACPHAASEKVVDGLRARGFVNTAVLDEGFFVWMQRGYPTTFGMRE